MSQSSNAMPLLSGLEVDPTEAPEGFYAVAKESLTDAERARNFCVACDFRAQCNDPTTDLKRHDHRCADYPVVMADGRELIRYDGCSVVFKRLEVA